MSENELENLLNPKQDVLSHLPTKNYNHLVQEPISQLGNFEPLNESDPTYFDICQLTRKDYGLEFEWQFDQLRKPHESNLFDMEESTVKTSWQNPQVLDLLKGDRRSIENHMISFNRLHIDHPMVESSQSERNESEIYENYSNESQLDPSVSKPESSSNQNAKSIDPTSIPIIKRPSDQLTYFSWDYDLKLKENSRATDDRFKKLKFLYDSAQVNENQSNSIHIISESELIQELISLLLNSPKTIFEYNEEADIYDFDTTLNIQFSSSSQEALETFCIPFLRVATHLNRLENVYRQILALPKVYGLIGLAFSKALQDYLNLINYSILVISEEISTLKPVQLLNQIEDMAAVLERLCGLCHCDVDLNLEEIINNLVLKEIIEFGFYLPKKAHLLSYLYENITLNLNHPPQLVDLVCLSLLKESCTPWFEWLNGWLGLSNGHTSLEGIDTLTQFGDPYEEFFVASGYQSQSKEQDPVQAFMTNVAHINIENIPKFHYDSIKIPQFFELELGQRVLNAGKCLNLLKQLISTKDEELEIIKELKLKRISWNFWNSDGDQSINPINSNHTNNDQYFDKMFDNIQRLRNNQLLELVSEDPPTFETSFFNTLSYLLGRVGSLDCQVNPTLYLDPLPRTLAQSIHQPLESLTLQIETATMRQLIRHEDFQTHIQIIQIFFLMQDGTMSVFIKKILDQLSMQDDEFDQSSRWNLSYYLHRQFKDYLSKLSSSTSLNVEKVLEYLKFSAIQSSNFSVDQFNLMYEPPFPFNQLISKDLIQYYQSIFHFFTKLIQCEFSLHRLYSHYTQLYYSESTNQSIFKVLLNRLNFKKKIIQHWQFVGHEILTRQMWKEFQKNMTTTISISKWIRDHHDRVVKLYNQLFLPFRLPRLKELLKLFINEIIEFENLFDIDQYLNNNSIESLIHFDNRLTSITDELERMIHSVMDYQDMERDRDMDIEPLTILEGYF